jgi:putative hemolysin
MMVLLLVLMLFSGLAAMAEVAFSSLTQGEAKEFREANGLVWRLLRKPHPLLATILIFGTLINITFIFVAVMEIHELFLHTSWAGKLWLPWVEYPLYVVAISFALLLFGEVTPKIYAQKRRVQLVNLLAVPVFILRIVLTPVSFILVFTSNAFERRIKTNGSTASSEDIKHAIDLTSEEESPEEEKEILKGIVDFGNIMVKSVMRSRVDMVGVEVGTSLEEVLELVNQQGYSRMPVYEDSLDNVTGILYVKDLIPLLKANRSSDDWMSLVRPAYFIPETKKIDSLLEEFKSRRLHIAIVADEFGGTSGLVTLEDIIEEIFGDIVDEFDEEEIVVTKLSETEYLVDGKMPLHDLIATMELPDHVFDEVRGTADTLAGLILELHRKIPAQGEQIVHGQFQFTVESVEQNRIKRVRLVVVPESQGTEDGGQGTEARD